MSNPPLTDTDLNVETLSSAKVFSGAIWAVTEETFRFRAGSEQLTRQFISHPGAVAVLCVDDTYRVRMIRQYRHPIGKVCWEIPAGLKDVDGESAQETAERELAEEADLIADNWQVLAEHYPSSGSSAEHLTIFLATGLHNVPEQQRHQRSAEEAEMTHHWVDFHQLLAAVENRDITNANTVIAVLAARDILAAN